MEILEELFRAKGAMETKLEVRVSNEPAINLYRSMGYTIAGIYQGYYSDGEDAYIMSKNLYHQVSTSNPI
jgi:ribosomal protein S18 acetylase RimI-like enzyme